MNTINHALWGATIGRTVGLPLEGAVAGSLPDLLSLPFLIPTYIRGQRTRSQIPQWLFSWYSFTHNWLICGFIIISAFLISPKFSVLGMAYFWHVIEDSFFHKDFAVAFLYPLWKGKVQWYSAANNPWVQILDILAILIVNFILSVYKVKLY